MNAIAILVGLGLAAAIVAFLGSTHHDGAKDLGTVSGQWLAEHRHSQES